MRVSLLPEHVALAHKPARAHLLLAAVIAAALPILGLCYLSGIVWSRNTITNAADVVASQRSTLGRPASGAVPLTAAGAGADSSTTSCQAIVKPIPPPQTRQDIAHLLQQENFVVGAELGVQHGVFTAETLWAWKGCQRYYLIDPYNHQQQRVQIQEALQSSAQGRVLEDQEDILQQAQENLQGWQQKLVWLRNTTTEAALLIKEPLDYVYLDARKDFCGLTEDLKAWWPLVKPGGIMAGYSYGDAADIKRNSGQDWSRCADGTTVHNGAVQAAVIDFFDQQGLQVVVTYRERQGNSWLVRKPHNPCSSQPVAGATAQGHQEEPLTQLLSMMLQQAPQEQPQSQQQQQHYEGLDVQQQQQQQEQQQQNAADEAKLAPSQEAGKDEEAAQEAQREPDAQQQQQQQQHITDHQEPEERKQQLEAALLKLHDSSSLAKSRAEQEATPQQGTAAGGDVFGDIFSAQEEAR